MSKPKRYIFRIRECHCVKREHLEGKYAPPALIIEETKENYGWVKWDDYARLKAEVEELTGLLKASTYYNTSDEVTRLKAEVERLTKASQGAVKYVDHTMALTRQSMEHHKQVSRLEAQVERLTKAGDYMSSILQDNYNDIPDDPLIIRDGIRRWNAAKEGKQP